LVFLVVSSFLVFPPISYMHFSSLPFVLHAPPIISFTWSFWLLLAKITICEAPHYAAFSNLLSLHVSLFQISFSAPCSQTLSVYVPLLMSKTKFCTHTKLRAKLRFCIM
jgi:hypothetical protein